MVVASIISFVKKIECLKIFHKLLITSINATLINFLFNPFFVCVAFLFVCLFVCQFILDETEVTSVVVMSYIVLS
jgi:hypothetical protein